MTMDSARIQAQGAGWKYRVWSETTSFLQVVVEILPISLWVFQFGNIHAALTSTILVFLAAILGIYFSSRLFQYYRIHIAVRLGMIFSWMTISILLAYRVLYGIDTPMIPFILDQISQTGSAAVMLPLFMILGFAWRSIGLASRLPEASTLHQSVSIQLIILILFGIAFPSHALDHGLTVFYFVLLLAVIGFMTQKIASLGDLNGGRIPFIDRTWTLWLAATAATVLIVSIGLGWVMQGKLSILLGQATLVLVFGVISLIGVLISPVLILIFLAVIWLSSFYATATGSEPVDLMGTENFDRLFEGEVPRETIEPFLQSIEPYLWAALVVVLLIGIGWLVRRQIILNTIQTEGEESTAISGVKRSEPQPLAQRIRERLLPRSLYHSVRIRWIYAQLCHLGDRLGVSRPAATTPREYLPNLMQIFPEQRESLSIITLAYQSVRYGQIPEDGSMIAEVEQHWKSIRMTGNAALRQRRRKGEKGSV